MHSFKKSFVSAVAAGMLVLSATLPAFATGTNPDLSDVTYACNNIPAEILNIAPITTLDASKVHVIYIDKILTPVQVVAVKDSLNNTVAQANILSLQNVLNLKSFLNGLSILSCAQFLNNNQAVLKDVIAIEHLNDGGINVFCCH